MPRRLGLEDPGTRFSAEEMNRRLNVLFIFSQPTRSPAASVHATLLRFLDPQRVRCHVVYNRLAASEPYASSGRSVLDLLPRTPDLALIPAEFGPVGGGPRGELIAGAGRALAPAARDAGKLVAHLRRHRIDVIHCEEGPRNAFYGLALSRLSGARCIVHFHSKYGSWMSPLSRIGVRRADAIIAVSSWTGQVMADAGVPAERIFPVLNGLDLTGWDPATADGKAVRREFSLEPGDPLVVSVAQLTAWKRQAVLIEAFAKVAARHPRARLLLVGKDWSPGAGYLAQLKQQVAEAALEPRVIFADQRGDVPELLAAADVFALPSVDDPCALAHLEAMAMAKPIVTVSAGGAPELVRHGETGLVGRPDDADQLADHLLELLEDPERRLQIGRAARERACEYFTARRMADEVEAVYRFVSGRP